MQQHPVPQNITGFEFKLVGFLTIRQFGYVAAAGVISFLIFIIFPGLLRWIFITPFAIVGLALAFGNISGLNFDHWLVAFFNAVTKPTQRVWRKEAKTFSFLDPRFAYYLRRPPAVLGEAKDRKKLAAFLSQRKSVVEEQIGKSPDYIASEHNFKPVASVRFPDKNIHVVPLSNTKVRGVTPVGLSGSVTLPVRGERVFDLGEGIREPLEKRLGRLLENATTKIAGPTDLGQNASTQETSNSNAAYVKTELDKLRELAKQELSKRQGQGRLEIRPLNTHLGSVVADQTRPTPPVAVPTPTHTPTTTNEGPANEATSEL